MVGSEPSRVQRVVAFLASSAPSPDLGESVKLLRPASGYEAAAEMLSSPVAALLVDLGRITAAHVGLLALAGRRATPTIAYGTISTGLRHVDLSGFELVTCEQAPAAVAELLHDIRDRQQVTPEAVAPAKPEASDSPAPEPSTRPTPAQLTPAKPSPSLALTSEELKALLGDD